MNTIKPVGLAESVRIQMRKTIEEIYLLWLKQEPLDTLRKVTVESESNMSIRLESFKGSRTFINFRNVIEFEPAILDLEKEIKTNQVELLGFLTLPGSSVSIRDTKQLISSWCGEIDKRISLGNKFDTVYDQLIEDLNTLLIKRKVICNNITFISGLNLPVDFVSAELGKNVFLRRLTHEELSEHYSEDALYASIYKNLSDRVSIALIIDTEVDISLGSTSDENLLKKIDSYTKIQTEINSLLKNLHILKKGKVNATVNYQIYKPSALPFMTGGASWRHFINPYTGMTLEHSDIEELKKIYERTKAHQCHEVNLAAARLMDAENRLSSSDALIDSMIGIETLLNPENTPEINYRVAMNYAFLFTPSKRVEKFKQMRNLYNKRSKIVHGELDVNLDSEAEVAKECLRTIINLFLKDVTLSKLSHIDQQFWTARMLTSTQLKQGDIEI